MTGLKLFRVGDKKVKELESHSVTVEKSFQTLIEKNLESMLGIRFVASEYPLGKPIGGRIDTIGLDDNNSPAIVKYKRTLNENIFNQGVYYLDWLAERRSDFQQLTVEALGVDVAATIQWGNPRLILIAGDFSRFDEHTAEQLGRNIELVRYRQFDIGFLLLELVYVALGTSQVPGWPQGKSAEDGDPLAGAAQQLEESDRKLFDLYQSLLYFLEALGDDVHKWTFESYIAFRRLKNFVCVVPDPVAKGHRLYLSLRPDSVPQKKGFIRDVRRIAHAGSGDLEILIKDDGDLAFAKPLLIESYDAN